MASRRLLTTSASLSHRYYNPQQIPPPQGTRKHLEWLWERPDPVPLPKTVEKPLADGSVFHTLVKRKPLYEYIDAAVATTRATRATPTSNSTSTSTTTSTPPTTPPATAATPATLAALAEKTLPPVCHDARHGKYMTRVLTADEQRAIQRDRRLVAEVPEVDAVNGDPAHTPTPPQLLPRRLTVDEVAERYQCSRVQVIALTAPKRRTKHSKWKWWFAKKYQAAI